MKAQDIRHYILHESNDEFMKTELAKIDEKKLAITDLSEFTLEKIEDVFFQRENPDDPNPDLSWGGCDTPL